MMGNIAKVLEM